MSRAWWRCPLGQCEHGAVVHDGDGNDEPFTCCVDGCGCCGHWVDPYDTDDRDAIARAQGARDG
jgi:hypothetical protein